VCAGSIEEDTTLPKGLQSWNKEREDKDKEGKDKDDSSEDTPKKEKAAGS
jgi:hypothetical protein